MTEHTVARDDVTLCVETFGRSTDPAILLVHGACASMLWWEEDFCARLAAGGRYVIRYDQRDTGRSTAWPVGAPDYGFADLADDGLAILDALGIQRAHIVGRSMGGAVALILAVDHPDRVSSVTFTNTTPGTGPDGQPLPEPSADFTFAEPPSEPGDAAVDYVVAVVRTYEGGSPHFDEGAVRARAIRDVARMRSVGATLTNHFLLTPTGPRGGGFADITVPTLVVHGDRDPVFPLAHGEAIAAVVPGAQLLTLTDVGHGIPPRTWPRVVDTLLRHTDR